MVSFVIATRTGGDENTTVQVGHSSNLLTACFEGAQKLEDMSDDWRVDIIPFDYVEERDIRAAADKGYVLGVNERGDEVLLFTAAGFRTLLERLTEKGRDQWLAKMWSRSWPDPKA